MTDLRPTIIPKSDQMNADDLIGRIQTIKITKVSLCSEADQPIAVHYEGDNGKPFKPCKSMRRVMVSIWGPDGNDFVGRSMTLYRDDKVQFGGLAVGGIRISHMSHIERDVTLALTATRANRKPFTVRPLKLANGDDSRRREATEDFPGDRRGPAEPSQTTTTLDQRVKAFDDRISAATAATKVRAMWAAAAQLRGDLERDDPEELQAMTDRYDARLAEVEEAEKGEQF